MNRDALSSVSRLIASLILAYGLSACTTSPETPTTDTPPPPAKPEPLPAAPVVAPATGDKGSQPTTPPAATTPVPATEPPPTLRKLDWESLPEWTTDNLPEAWPAFMQSCTALKNRPGWKTVCANAMEQDARNAASLRGFFERHFVPYAVVGGDNNNEGMITGYYEPLIQGSRTRTTKARFPIYAIPEDLITVDLASVYPELKSMRLRGRLEGNRLVPYATRGEIDAAGEQFKARVLAWAEDAVELFFLQIQGSGRVELADGSHLRIGYADQNGHPYKSIGKILVERGDLKLEQASMQGIKAWGAANPDKLQDLLNSNPSHVFFRELPNGLDGPLGALGVPLTGGRSIAIDPKFIPLGAPVFLSTTWPNSARTLNRLMLAQDTGGAIRGAVRADFYWGFGADAGELAGRMKQKGRLWVLLPREMSAPCLAGC